MMNSAEQEEFDDFLEKIEEVKFMKLNFKG